MVICAWRRDRDTGVYRATMSADMSGVRVSLIRERRHEISHARSGGRWRILIEQRPPQGGYLQQLTETQGVRTLEDAKALAGRLVVALTG